MKMTLGNIMVRQRRMNFILIYLFVNTQCVAYHYGFAIVNAVHGDMHNAAELVPSAHLYCLYSLERQIQSEERKQFTDHIWPIWKPLFSVAQCGGMRTDNERALRIYRRSSVYIVRRIKLK